MCEKDTLCSIALNSLITEPGLYVFWLEFQVVTQLSSAVLIVFRTVKRAIKDLRAEGVSLGSLVCNYQAKARYFREVPSPALF